MHIMPEYLVKTKYLSTQHGVQHIYKFPNGYGASVIMHEGSYGGRDGLWEVAILDQDGNLCYTTSITEDVIGYLDDEDLTSVLHEIKNMIV